MADAVIADLVIARNALLFAPLAQLFGEFRALDVLVRDEVVGRHQNLRRVENFIDAEFFEHLHGGRRGHVVRDDQVDLSVDDLAVRNRITPAVRGEDFFSDCHSHNGYSSNCRLLCAIHSASRSASMTLFPSRHAWPAPSIIFTSALPSRAAIRRASRTDLTR